ncbi:MAG TPA: hypothetical protein DEQ09_04090, partial [Bacteroidales bacterium]|nr:hypothetical protein [Bacteroidales bacterium]
LGSLKLYNTVVISASALPEKDLAKSTRLIFTEPVKISMMNRTTSAKPRIIYKYVLGIAT